MPHGLGNTPTALEGLKVIEVRRSKEYYSEDENDKRSA